MRSRPGQGQYNGGLRLGKTTEKPGYPWNLGQEDLPFGQEIKEKWKCSDKSI